MSLPGFYIDDLYIPVPIIQGGMGVGISLSGLAAAVAAEGGVGVISAAMIGFKEPDVRNNHTEANLRALRREIRRARELSSGVIGVNILASLTDFEAMASCAMDEGVDLIISGGGLPRTLPGLVKPGQKTKLIPVVSSGRAAELLARMWITRYNRVPDAFVVEGPLAGGHLGFKRSALDAPESRLEVLVKEVVEVAKKLKETHGRDVPVIAAGGIYTHQDILDMLA
ncbi:MAG: NAD(P)H-dependent flavin oxidoreductase, partial [Acidobacteriota bacterium]